MKYPQPDHIMSRDARSIPVACECGSEDFTLGADVSCRCYIGIPLCNLCGKPLFEYSVIDTLKKEYLPEIDVRAS